LYSTSLTYGKMTYIQYAEKNKVCAIRVGAMRVVPAAGTEIYLFY